MPSILLGFIRQVLYEVTIVRDPVMSHTCVTHDSRISQFLALGVFIVFHLNSTLLIVVKMIDRLAIIKNFLILK